MKIATLPLLIILSLHLNAQDQLSDIVEQALYIQDYRDFYGEKSEDIPMINLSSFHSSQTMEKMDKFKSLHKKLNAVSPDLKNTVLWNELDSYIKEKHIQYSECRVGDWSYVKDWSLISYLESLEDHNFFGDEPHIVNNYLFSRQALLNISALVLHYNEKVQQALETKIIPSQASIMKTISDLEDSYLSTEALESYVQIIKKNYQCPSCIKSFDEGKFIQNYKEILLPKVNQLLKSLHSLRDLSEQSIYPLPKSIKHQCVSSIISSIAGLNLKPIDILEIGQKELTRAEQEMLKVLQKHLKKPQLTLSEMNTYMKNIQETELSYSSQEEYISTIENIISRTQDFSSLISSKKTTRPELYDFDEEVESFSNSYAKCLILINSKAPSPRYRLASLIIHEGIPGHYLDLCKDGDNSKFKQRNYKLANYQLNDDRVEGWAFYMEEVADELGFYQNPMERLGYLQGIKIRALRLILTYRYFFDDWTLEQALAYHKEKLVAPSYRHNSEVERSHSHKGQVLTYMLGKVAIKKMRTKAQQQLGKKFNLINFHDFFLSYPEVSLATLSKILPQWIADQK